MRYFLEKIGAQPGYEKAMYWGKLVTITGSAQILIQLLSLLSGILIIRLLPVQEYAFYTLANTMLGTMTVLADGGISSGVMAEGGKVWQDKKKLGIVLATGLDLRKKFAVGSLIVSVPILTYLLWYHGASWLTIFLITLALIPAFFAALSDSLLEIIPKLHQHIKPLQKNQINVSAGRLLLSGLTLFIFPWTFIALLANGIPRIYGNIRLKGIAYLFADKNEKAEIETKKAMMRIIKKVMPGAIYYCLSGQIIIWFISIFGSTTALAQVGALSRLIIIFNLFAILFATLITPRFARLPNIKALIMRRFVQILQGTIILSILLITIFYLFSKNILWILGDDFSGLTKEVILISVAGCVSLISSCTNQLLSARGIIVPPIGFIFWTIGVQVGVAFTLQLSEVAGVLMYGIYTTSAIFFIRIFYFISKIRKNEITTEI